MRSPPQDEEGRREAGDHPAALLPRGRVGLRGGGGHLPRAGHHARLPDVARHPPPRHPATLRRGHHGGVR